MHTGELAREHWVIICERGAQSPHPHPSPHSFTCRVKSNRFPKSDFSRESNVFEEGGGGGRKGGGRREVHHEVGTSCQQWTPHSFAETEKQKKLLAKINKKKKTDELGLLEYLVSVPVFHPGEDLAT